MPTSLCLLLQATVVLGQEDLALPARWEAIRENSRVWTLSTFSSVPLLGEHLLSVLPSDYQNFCPELAQANELQKQNFYVYLLSAMAELESSFNPELTYQERFRDNQGRYVISRGVLQISIESSQNYECGFEFEHELHDPERNLQCGLRILNRWLGEDGLLASSQQGTHRGGARYWAVLRKPDKLEQIQSWTKEFCQTQL